MTSILRKILRRAEQTFRDERVTGELQQEGIFVGEARQPDRDRLLAELERDDEDESPSILLTVNTGEAAVEDRGWFEDPVADYVETEGLGTWLGGGQGSIADRHFFDVSFSVNNIDLAIDKIRAFLGSRFPNVDVEVTSSHKR